MTQESISTENKRFCQCGCGNEVTNLFRGGRGNRPCFFKIGHNVRTKRYKLIHLTKYCECGCGEIIKSFDKSCRSIRYKFGHSPNKGKKRPNITGEHNGSWKGGRIIDRQGYALVRGYGHPKAKSNGYVLEHILIMEKYLNRHMKPNEIIHHVDGNPSNNKIENLQIMTRYQHISHHRKDMIAALKNGCRCGCNCC